MMRRLFNWSERYFRMDMTYFLHSNFWLLFGRVISIGSGMVLTIAFANLLAPEQFGTYKYILALTSIVGAFSLSGMGTALTRQVARGEPDIVLPLSRLTFLASLPASLITICIGAYYFLHGNSLLGFGLLFIAFQNPFSNTVVLYKALFQGKGDFKGLTLYAIPGGILQILTMLGVLILTRDVLAVVATYFAVNLLVGGIVYFIAIRKYRIHKTSGDPSETITYAKHLSVLGLAFQFGNQLDQLILWHSTGPIALAQYTLAIAPIRELQTVAANVFSIVFPRFASKSTEEIKKALPFRILQMTLVSALLAGAYIVCAPFLFATLFPKYLPSIGWSQILALTLVLQAKGLIETALTAQAKVRKRYITVGATYLTRIIAYIVLIPPYGIAGAIAATVISEICNAIILWIAYKKL